MKIFVTGGTGFVGSAVVRTLLEAGHEVRALVRKTSVCSNLDGLSIERVQGDLRDLDSLESAIVGCKALFHVAADYRLWSRNPRELYASNVEGTRNILTAAVKTGVERIVYTSSVATLGLNPDKSPADERTPSDLDKMIGHYKRSKFLAEELVREFMEKHRLSVVIVNPSTPVGPRDIKPTPTGRMVRDAAAGRIPAYVDTGLNIVHVEDVAIGHRLAFESGKEGERYILGGTNMSLKQILVTIAEIAQLSPPRIRLPNRMMIPVAYVAEGWTRMKGSGEPLLTVDGLRMARRCMYFSSDKALRELGYAPRPAREALHDAVKWFR